jgi:hypothetical protein
VDSLQRILASGEIVRRCAAVEAEVEDIGDTVTEVEATTNTLASNYTTILAQVGVHDEQIVELFDALDGVGGSGLTPQQSFILGLVSAVDTVLGSISQQVLDSIRLSEALASATIADMVRGREDGAAIRVEQAVRTTETSSLAQQITTLNADLGTANAAITEEITARATADAANATAIANLTTTVNGNTAQITSVSESIDGLEAYSTIAVNINGQVVGLQSLAGGPAGSEFTVVADRLRFAQPGVSGGDPVLVLAIANVAGTPKLALRGDMLADGAIVARAIAAAVITGDKIAANTLTADKINVANLAAITGTLGSVTTGRIQSPDGRLDINALSASPYIRLTA